MPYPQRSIRTDMSEPVPPCPFETTVPLSAVGYYAIGGRARWFARPGSVQEMVALLGWCHRNQLPAMVTGKGSNMLFADDDFPGVVFTTASMQRIFRVSDHQIFCEAGVENSEVALALFDAGLGGGEWLYRLPGMIGATVRMNGRCYGREISEVASGIVTAGLDGSVRFRQRGEIFRGYKETTLMEGGEVVAGVLLELPGSKPKEEIRSLMEGYGRDREAKHQFDFPSCGSTFKNSYAAGRPSGQIFESLGFKGRREGRAKVSEHHANFIFNTGGAKAVDVLRLAAEMRQAARDQAGAELELELQCAGLFDASLLAACGVPAVPEPSRPGYAWAGLLRFPEGASATFPRTLLDGPLFDYSGLCNQFPQGLQVRVEQLLPMAEARREPERSFIRWTTRDLSGTTGDSIPDTMQGSFTDRLWEFGVSELFLGGQDGYLEFESTAAGHWIALRFDAPRVRSAGHETPSEALWGGGVRPLVGQTGFGMEFSFSLLEPFIRDGDLPLQCCASLGQGRFGLFPWWNDSGTPDFHQPARFCPVRLV